MMTRILKVRRHARPTRQPQLGPVLVPGGPALGRSHIAAAHRGTDGVLFGQGLLMARRIRSHRSSIPRRAVTASCSSELGTGTNRPRHLTVAPSRAMLTGRPGYEGGHDIRGVAVQRDRPVTRFPNREVDGPGRAGGQWNGQDLAALAQDDECAVAKFQAEHLDVGPGGLRRPKPVQGQQRDEGVLGCGPRPGATSRAPTSLRSRPAARDSLSMRGRRTCTAGEWSISSSSTA